MELELANAAAATAVAERVVWMHYKCIDRSIQVSCQCSVEN